RHCLEQLGEGDDTVMPIFSSGQWAGTLPFTLEQVGSNDLMFLCGGGIIAHPDGPAAGVASLRQAYDACKAGVPLDVHSQSHPELAAALARFGGKA
ncbi:MAG: RuBisCO large subunit C-terminal-like domain-containing protein, partial [Aliihoeflea sp.]